MRKQIDLLSASVRKISANPMGLKAWGSKPLAEAVDWMIIDDKKLSEPDYNVLFN